MGNEIEKKWIIPASALSYGDLCQRASSITSLTQGYLNVKHSDIHIHNHTLYCFGERIRVSNDVAERLKTFIENDGLQDAELRYRHYSSEKSVLTIKGAGGLIRFEEEIDITSEQVQSFEQHTIGFIKKNRYKIPDGSFMLEVDVYDRQHNFPFSAIEVEFATVEEANGYQLPACFGTNIRDVTEDKVFKNKNLALYGNRAKKVFEQLFASVSNESDTLQTHMNVHSTVIVHPIIQPVCDNQNERGK